MAKSKHIQLVKSYKSVFLFIALISIAFLPESTYAKNPSIIKTIPADETKIHIAESQTPAPPSAKILSAELRTKKQARTLATTDIITNGVNYLKTSQTPEGAWTQYPSTAFIDTIAVARFFEFLEMADDASYTSAIDWFSFFSPENNEYLAEKTRIIAGAGQNPEYLMQFLASQINNNLTSGFGYAKAYKGNPVTTAKVLEALFQSNYQDSGPDPLLTLKAILLSLINTQNSDGGWPRTYGETSSLYATTIVLNALHPYQTYILGTTEIKTPIALSLNYLKTEQQSNGTWQDNLLYTALAFDTLLNYQAEPVYHQEALDYIHSNQNTDGSFANGNIYKTAKCLRALAKPNIELIDIQKISDNPPTISVSIKNTGYLTSKPLNLAAEPCAFVLTVDNRSVTYDFSDLQSSVIFAPDSTLILQIELNGHLSYGSHSINFTAEYDNAEFYKNDNTLTKEVVFDDPAFDGPTPPTWIGASTGSEPGQICLRWLASEDIDTAQYAIYASGQSGVYDTSAPLGTFSKDQLWVNYTFNSPRGVPIYFTIASLDTNNIRGDYSKETWAIAYDDPASAMGTISGKVKDTYQQGIPNAQLESYNTFETVSADSTGQYTLAYYPGFYRTTATGLSYSSLIKEIEIRTQDSNAADFTLEAIQDGTVPTPVTGLTVQADNAEVTLTWNPFQDIHGDFYRFNIYRSLSPIQDISGMEPIGVVTDQGTTSFTDTTIANGVNYYYAVAVQDTAGNASPGITYAESVSGNSAPGLLNLKASQEGKNVLISYDLEDNENNTVLISFQYWNGTNWNEITTATGEGEQPVGIQKAGIWNAKQDLPDFKGQAKIKILADDTETVNNFTEKETTLFYLNTRDPNPLTVSYTAFTTEYLQTISGTKDADTSIFINDQEAVSLDENTSWSYELVLEEGENILVISSRDEFGNESDSITITITLDSSGESLKPDLVITSIENTTSLVNGNPASFHITLKNNGQTAADSMHLYVFTDNFQINDGYDLGALGYIIEAQEEAVFSLSFTGTTTKRLLGDTEIKFYIEGENESDYQNNWLARAFNFASAPDGSPALPLYYIANKHDIDGSPAINIRWAERDDPNRLNYVLMYRIAGTSAWSYKGISTTWNGTFVFGVFSEGQTYEVTA
ncbi:MAG: hypothetical protein GY749_16850, partial [Desulfobacteraceae bacterium]|nr:hypothetical protein [Desulfobacteraceae bacterium]